MFYKFIDSRETFKQNLTLIHKIEMKIWILTLWVEGLPSFFWTVLEAAGSRGCSAGWLRLDGFSDGGESPFLKEKQISYQILASNPCDMGSFNNYVEKMRWVGRWSIQYTVSYSNNWINSNSVQVWGPFLIHVHKYLISTIYLKDIGIFSHLSPQLNLF